MTAGDVEGGPALPALLQRQDDGLLEDELEVRARAALGPLRHFGEVDDVDSL